MTTENKSWFEEKVKDLKLGMVIRWGVQLCALIVFFITISSKVTTAYDGIIARFDKQDVKIDNMDKKASAIMVDNKLMRTDVDKNKEDIAIIFATGSYRSQP